MADLTTSPQVVALLHDAKEHPEDDVPRLVLADWLEEHGDSDRAEFIRLQCRLAPGSSTRDEAGRDRMQQLLSRHGGAWPGPLWRWWLSPLAWHRGLLAARLPRHVDADEIAEVLPWLDTALVEVTGRRAFQRVARLLAATAVNHLFLDCRPRVTEQALLDVVAQVPASACLRTLSIDWPVALLLLSGQDGAARLAVSRAVVAKLAGLPVARHLTHLGSAPPLSPEQAEVVRQQGIEPVHARERFWMHALSPVLFSRR